VNFRKIITWVSLFVLFLILAFFYRKYNPEGNVLFPKCPFKEITGFKCPGCGSQRAIHHLLNFDVLAATRENVILVISIPYILLGVFFDSVKTPTPAMLKARKFLFGQKAIMVILLIIIGFWILRNLPYFNS